MSIRVLQIIPTLVRGGAEKQLALLATGLPSDQFDVHVAVLTEDGPYRQDLDQAGIPVSFVDKRFKVDPAAYLRLKRIVQRLRPDIVHTWIFAANAYGRAAALAARVPAIIAGERCADHWKVWHELALDRYLARRTHRIATNSTGVRDFYVERGLPAEKFVVIPNGIRVQPHDRQQCRSRLLEELQLPSHSRLLGAVGRLWPQKRYKDLIWAAELLKAARDDVHLLIAGEGPQRDLLERFRRQVGVVDCVHFLGQRDDIPRVLAGLDCFWLGSGYEGQSNALMEAMAQGVPVVASDIAGNRDLVIPEETGWLVPVGNAAAFARATQFVLDDPALAQRMGQSAQQRMRDAFSVPQMIDRHAHLYRELAQRA